MPTAQQRNRVRRGNRRPNRTSRAEAASDPVNVEPNVSQSTSQLSSQPSTSRPTGSMGTIVLDGESSDEVKLVKFNVSTFQPPSSSSPSSSSARATTSAASSGIPPAAATARAATPSSSIFSLSGPLLSSSDSEEDEEDFFHEHHVEVTRTIHYLTSIHQVDIANDPDLAWPPASIQDMHEKNAVTMSQTFQDVAVLEAFAHAKEDEADFFQEHLSYFNAIDALREMSARDGRINLSRRVGDIKLWESVAHGKEVVREIAATVETQRVYFGVQLDIVKKLDAEVKRLEDEQRKYDWKLGLLNAAHCASMLYPIKGDGFDQDTLDQEMEVFREVRDKVLPMKWKLEAALGNFDMPLDRRDGLDMDLAEVDVVELMAMISSL